jgi:hypothetical protein
LTGRAAIGENPLLCANEKEIDKFYLFFVCLPNTEEDLRVGVASESEHFAR